jgi:spore maturation protein CgeB
LEHHIGYNVRKIVQYYISISHESYEMALRGYNTSNIEYKLRLEARLVNKHECIVIKYCKDNHKIIKVALVNA